MPNTRENAPPPPPDTDVRLGGAPADFGVVGTAMAVIVAVMVGVGIFLSGAETRNTAFMAKCIEFHSSDRCSEFWRYGRADLAERLER